MAKKKQKRKSFELQSNLAPELINNFSTPKFSLCILMYLKHLPFSYGLQGFTYY